MINTTSTRRVDFVLITALEEELLAVLRQLSEYKPLLTTEDFIQPYYETALPVFISDGTTGSYRVIVMGPVGMGRVNAATATAEAIQRWHPRYIVLIGIAGGIEKRGIGLGDILIADQIVDYELQKITPEGPEVRWEVHRTDARLLKACSAFRDEIWLEAVKTSRPQPGKPKRYTGPIASGDTVIAFDEVLEKYQAIWPKLIGVEMEAAGVATAAFQSADRPGFFMVRGVSDLADENKGSAEVESWRPYAREVAAAFTIAFLKSGPVPLAEESLPVEGIGLNAPVKQWKTILSLVITWGIVGIAGIFGLVSVVTNWGNLRVAFFGPTPTPVVSVTTTTISTIPFLPTPTLTPSPTRKPTSTRAPTFTPSPAPCVCQSSTDYESMTCLIDKESEAANLGSLELIQLIYAPNAVIFRGDTKETWNDPVSYYKPAFEALTFSDAAHFDPTQVKVIGQTAYWVSGSSGNYTRSGGQPTPYDNAAPSDHWIFQRNQKGCWVITRYEFNAGLIPFPP